MNIKNWIDKNCDSLEGKTVLVTGSTGGLAREYVNILSSLGANFIFANRNLEKSNNQKQELLKSYPNIKIEIIKTDMFDFESVKRFCDTIKLREINYLVINSAVYNIPRQKSNLGYDNVFQINFVSPYYIVKQLLPTLQKNNGRVIAIGSIAYNYSKLNKNDIDFSKTKKATKVYGNSKRILMLSLYKLFENEKIVKLSVVHPGITLTQITNHYPKFINWLVKIGIKLLFPSPKKACLSIVKGIYSDVPKNYWIGPSRFNIWGYPKLNKVKNINENEQNNIFLIAENIYNKCL